MQDGTFRTNTCAVYEILTIQLGPQIISVEKLECFDGLKIIYMFLGHLRYLKQPQLILIVDQSTALSNMKHCQLGWLPEQHKHHQLQYHPELLKTSPITVLPCATQKITNVHHQHCLFVHIFSLCPRDSYQLILDYPVLTVTNFQIYCHMMIM
jgi:hypothetical protein